jgi:trans-aconitate methyltransferase
MLSSNALHKRPAPAANRFSPEFYDGMYGQFGAYNEGLARICAAAAPIDEVGDLVELGSGTGLFSQPLIAAFRPRRFTGIDPNAAMLEEARRRIVLPNVMLHCGTAQDLPMHVAAGTIDVIAVKASFHLFNHQMPLDALLGFLTGRGRLIIVERTPRSAASYPIFDQARAHWDEHLVRQSADPMHQHAALLARCSYGCSVRLRAEGYFAAIEHGQLSFAWPFDQELVRTWTRLTRSVSAEFLDVYEEFEVSVFGAGR